MANWLNLAFQFLDSFAFIVLAAAGLAIIFGIMGVINLAHGEFILVGAYATTLAVKAVGLPLPAAMLAGAVVTAGFGLVVERTIISGAGPNWVWERLEPRLSAALPDQAAAVLPSGPLIEPLYDRLADSMVATFGLSLIMVQGARIVFGNSIDQVATPFGEVAYGAFSYSAYRLVLAGVSVALLGLVYYVFTYTDYGMRARAVIQDDRTARALGVNTERTYAATFALGSGLAGLTGALFAPVISMQPTLGSQFLVEAFVAVVVGGASVVLGTALSAAGLGAIESVFSNQYGTFFGRIALLLTAILALRFLPGGITGYIERVRKRRRRES
ncbi:urea ABC transporter, permease protein UrtB [Halobacteriales archaeon QH_10_67_22]|jgi:branched-chain amino acid transport system permease protein|nr:MAG: urea ABC transporter, permease protein UrtB [Halobacteriales archaeon QH_10_67_22]